MLMKDVLLIGVCSSVASGVGGNLYWEGANKRGAEIETPRGMWRGLVERGGVSPFPASPPQPTRSSGGASYAPPAWSGAEPRPKMGFGAF